MPGFLSIPKSRTAATLTMLQADKEGTFPAWDSHIAGKVDHNPNNKALPQLSSLTSQEKSPGFLAVPFVQYHQDPPKGDTTLAPNDSATVMKNIEKDTNNVFTQEVFHAGNQKEEKETREPENLDTRSTYHFLYFSQDSRTPCPCWDPSGTCPEPDRVHPLNNNNDNKNKKKKRRSFGPSVGALVTKFENLSHTSEARVGAEKESFNAVETGYSKIAQNSGGVGDDSSTWLVVKEKLQKDTFFWKLERARRF